MGECLNCGHLGCYITLEENEDEEVDKYQSGGFGIFDLVVWISANGTCKAILSSIWKMGPFFPLNGKGS